MPWIRRQLRDNTVYVRVDSTGTPVVGKDKRVDVKYKPNATAKVYRAALRNLEKTGDPKDEEPISWAGDSSTAASAAASVSTRKLPDDAVVIYTDGACTGNPGPAGIGVVIMDGDERRELSEYLGSGTNNIAELTAIERALEEVLDRSDRPVVVHSDSSYSIGLLTKNWKAKANKELVARLRTLTARFGQLSFVKVKGHAGIPENERCDELAREAIYRRR